VSREIVAAVSRWTTAAHDRREFLNFWRHFVQSLTDLPGTTPELLGRQSLSARLNFLDCHWSQYKQAEENENKTSLPLLGPPLPQIDSNCADGSTKKAYDRQKQALPS